MYRRWKNPIRLCKPTYETWANMLRRCHVPTTENFENYGGRGVVVCDRWRESFDAFVEDMGFRPEGMTIDRLDSNGNYERENCRWATIVEQAQNRRTARYLTFGGRTQSLTEWAKEFEISVCLLRYRLKKEYDL